MQWTFEENDDQLADGWGLHGPNQCIDENSEDDMLNQKLWRRTPTSVFRNFSAEDKKSMENS